MISCNECQKKMVSVLDNESNTEDAKLLFAHLADCEHCYTFYKELIGTRQLFSIATAIKEPVTIGRDFMRTVETDALRSRKLSSVKHIGTRALSHNRFSRMVWAGAAAAFLIAASWLVSLNLAQKVRVLTHELESSRQEIALTHEKEQVKNDQERQQKAISALYFRMQELEERVNISASPRSSFFPAERNGL